MSARVHTAQGEPCRDRGAPLYLSVEYAPDVERAARALLLIAGLSEDEIERVMAELALESSAEM